MTRKAVEIIIGGRVLELFAEGRILLSPRDGTIRPCPGLGTAEMVGMQIGHHIIRNPRKRPCRAGDIIRDLPCKACKTQLWK